MIFICKFFHFLMSIQLSKKVPINGVKIIFFVDIISAETTTAKKSPQINIVQFFSLCIIYSTQNRFPVAIVPFFFYNIFKINRRIFISSTNNYHALSCTSDKTVYAACTSLNFSAASS